MFFIKEELKDGVSIEVELTGEAVTYCPDCGAEMKFDLIDLIRSDKEFDFYGTSIYCEKCSKNHSTAGNDG
ncbi:MAG: hypothetical protein J6A19_15595 [Oscillospiraceae bacterium]|nr:hypothetical protein [Oscillospiraceae bacterium]